MKKFNIPPALIALPKKIFLYSLGAVASFFLLFVLSAFVALVLFPPERYRGQIEERLRSALGSEKVKIEKITIDFSLKNLSVGVVAKDLSVQGGNGIQSVLVPKTQILVNPFKIFLGRIPLDIQAYNPVVKLEDFGKQKSTAESAPRGGQKNFRALQKYSRFFKVGLKVDHAQIDLEALLATPGSTGASVVKLENSNLEGQVNGADGKIDLQISSELNIDLEKGKMLLQGPAKLDFSGRLIFEEGEAKDLKVEEFSIDLDHTNLGSLGWIEKSPDALLRARVFGVWHFPKDGKPAHYAFRDSKLEYGPLTLTFDVAQTENSSFSFKFSAPKTEINGIQIPITSLREVELNGAVELNGEFKTHPSGDRVGLWRVTLNNLTVPFNTLPGIDPKASRGDLVFSLKSQGTYDNGIVNCPATEIQASATPAQIEDKAIHLMKTAGDKADLLFKATVENNLFEVKKFALNLHTMTLNGKGYIENFSEFLRGEKTLAKFSFFSNRVDLSGWGSFFPPFRRQPTLDGFFEVKANASSLLSYRENPFKDLAWNVDRLNLTNIQGKLDRSSWAPQVEERLWSVLGPFRGNLLVKGRGTGQVVDRAEVLANLDLSNTRIVYKDSFEKKEGIPLSFNLMLDQTHEKFNLRQGNLKFHDLDLNFRGILVQGSKSNSVALVMNKPIDLSNWNEFVRKKSSSPLKGLVQWKGNLTFPTDTSLTQTNFDWKKFRIDGELNLRDGQYKFIDQPDPITQFSAQIVFGPKFITVPRASFQKGPSKFVLSGEIENLAKNQGNTLWQWMNNKAWKIDSQIQMDKLTLNTDSSRPNVKKEMTSKDVREQLDSPYLRESALQVALRIGEGKFAEIPFSGLNAKLVWDQGLLRLEPFSLKTLDGKVVGSAIYNFKNYYNRQDEPVLNATLKSEGLNLQQLAHHVKPPLEKTLGGLLKGEIVLSSQGFVPRDLLARAKGRVGGEISKGYFDSLKVLQESFQNLARDEKLAQFLTEKAATSPCIEKNFSAVVDAQINNGEVTVESGRLKFASQTELLLNGKISPDMTLDMKGDIMPSASCVKPETFRCLKNQEGNFSLPYTLNGSAYDAKAQIAYTELGRKIASCGLKKVQEKAKELYQEKSREFEAQAKDQVKKLFKGL